MDIKWVKREDIDKLKWDSCVHFANFGNMYGYTWYLDYIAKEWDGLVEGDYTSVFPLIRQTKRGNVLSLHQPELIPKTGIYSVHVLSPARVSAFMDKIPAEYEMAEVAFSKKVTLPEGQTAEVRTDYELVLQAPYDIAYGNYTPELRAILDAAETMDFRFDPSIKPERLADFYWNHHKGAKERNMHAYLRIMYNVMHRGMGFLSAMRDAKGQIVAGDFFAFSHGRIVSLMPTYRGENGRHALYLLTDMMVQRSSGGANILDFNVGMGDIRPALFGAKPVPYTVWKMNRTKGLRRLLYGRG